MDTHPEKYPGQNTIFNPGNNHFKIARERRGEGPTSREANKKTMKKRPSSGLRHEKET